MKPCCRTCRVSAVCLAFEPIESAPGPYGAWPGVYRTLVVAQRSPIPAHDAQRMCMKRMACMRKEEDD